MLLWAMTWTVSMSTSPFFPLVLSRDSVRIGVAPGTKDVMVRGVTVHDACTV